jgi:hypothetical protein
MPEKELSRRDFLRDAGAIAGSATITGAAPPVQAEKTAILTLLDPTGAQEITHLFAPRLPDLNGKVIAELAVDAVKWQPHRTMPYIEGLLKEQYPGVTFISMREFPMGLQISDDKTIKAVAARKPDAAIIGNAG